MKKIAYITILFLLATVLLIVAFLFLGRAEVSAPVADNDEDSMIACTMDAKLCPDGSYVGRVPPDCEFAPCPGE